MESSVSGRKNDRGLARPPHAQGAYPGIRGRVLPISPTHAARGKAAKHREQDGSRLTSIGVVSLPRSPHDLEDERKGSKDLCHVNQARPRMLVFEECKTFLTLHAYLRANLATHRLHIPAVTLTARS